MNNRVYKISQTTKFGRCFFYQVYTYNDASIEFISFLKEKKDCSAFTVNGLNANRTARAINMLVREMSMESSFCQNFKK
jgi:hypothetical protein